MLIGYARTSTLDQKASIEAQARDLKAAGCERLFSEQVSSVDVVNREQLAQALDFVVLPTTVFVNASGQIVKSHAGALDDDKLTDLIDKSFPA